MPRQTKSPRVQSRRCRFAAWAEIVCITLPNPGAAQRTSQPGEGCLLKQCAFLCVLSVVIFQRSVCSCDYVSTYSPAACWREGIEVDKTSGRALVGAMRPATAGLNDSKSIPILVLGPPPFTEGRYDCTKASPNQGRHAVATTKFSQNHTSYSLDS